MPKKEENIKINELQKSVDKLIKRVKELEISIKHDNKVKTKKIKDPNLPKKYKSAYIFFYIERLEEFKRKNPGKKVVVINISKESGKEWNKIKDNDKKVEKYKKMEEEDKKRLEKEKDIYENKNK